MRYLLAFAMILVALPAWAATVVVSVTGVRNDLGHVMVALCTKADFLQPHCRWKGRVPATAGVVHVTLQNVPAGIYAAQAFHDENDNGTLDRSFFGLPKEAMGFSNDAPMHMGPPRFDAAAFNVDAEEKQISFTLKYH